MVIVYCEKCGKRVPQSDIDAGRAVTTAENVWICADCAPKKSEKTAAAHATTGPRAPAAPSRRAPAAPVVAAADAPAPAAPARATAGVRTIQTPTRAATTGPQEPPPRRETAVQKPAAKPPPTLLIGAGAGAACGIVAVIVMLSGGRTSDDETAARKPDTPPPNTETAPPKDSPPPAGLGQGKTMEPPSPPSPPTETKPLSLAERAKQAEKEMEEMRNGRAARLLDGHKAWFAKNPANQWGYRARLQELISSNRSTPAAKEAERLLAELKPPPTARGRFVRVENLGQRRVLSLAEVQVFSAGKNVAPQGKASQSSTAHGGAAQRANDGNTNGRYDGGSVTHTNDEDAPWWEVDLGGEKEIEGIVVWNRTECIDRLQNFRVALLNNVHDTVWETTVREIPTPKVEFTPGK